VTRASVQTGLDILSASGFSSLKNKRVGLLCHPASVDSSLEHIVDLARQACLDVRLLFGPEHGIHGSAQDMEAVGNSTEPSGAIKVVSLYGDCLDDLEPNQSDLEQVDVLVVDLQDVGCRYYTYAATMLYCLQACARAGVAVLVLDRPNPINGIVCEGPLLEDELHSFVGEFLVPVRHGLTIGELAEMARSTIDKLDLSIIRMKGWRRGMWFDQTGLPWVLPSPNMPSLATATVYPGSCLLEATNLSEGRGTTRPFELLGAPWLDSNDLVLQLKQKVQAGVEFRPVTFVPAFQKHAGQTCHGLQLHVVDRKAYSPLAVGLAVLQAVRQQAPQHFAWRSEPYEFESDRPAIDLLTGTTMVRRTIDSAGDLEDLIGQWRTGLASYAKRRREFLLYPEDDA
jgi:uncharacterized protein YbbC (DUF1343 family)